MVLQAKDVCTTCARGVKLFTRRYHDFLIDPSTLFTLASLLLLITAGFHNPKVFLSGGVRGKPGAPFFLAAALVGSVFFGWSVFQGIRQGYFTADIPVSLATAAAIAIGQYSAAAVVAVVLLIGGVLGKFVAAPPRRALGAFS